MPFQVFATASSFKPAIERAVDQKMPADNAKVLDLTTNYGKDAAKTKKQSKLAIAYLTIAF